MAHLETARHSRGAAPVTRYSRGPHYKGRSPFGAPLRSDGTFIPTRPGPALPGNTGSTAKRASPMPVQQAPCSPITCRTGMMPRPSADKGDEPQPAETAPAPSKAVSADDVPHDERVGAIAQNQRGVSRNLIRMKLSPIIQGFLSRRARRSATAPKQFKP